MMFIHDRQHFFLVLSLNRLPLLFKICETVVTDTPAISAISLMVSFTLVAPFYLNSLSVYQNPQEKNREKESMFLIKISFIYQLGSLLYKFCILFILSQKQRLCSYYLFLKKNSSLFLKLLSKKN